MKHEKLRNLYEKFVALYQEGKGPQPKLRARRQGLQANYTTCDPTEWSDHYEYAIMFDEPT